MKKTLIAAAALTLAAGAAQAQLTIYGLIDLSYGQSILGDFMGEDPDFHSGGDNGSSEGNSTTRIGLKGSMDVGSGFKANFNLETVGIDSHGGIRNNEGEDNSPVAPADLHLAGYERLQGAGRLRAQGQRRRRRGHLRRCRDLRGRWSVGVARR